MSLEVIINAPTRRLLCAVDAGDLHGQSDAATAAASA